MLLHRLQDCPIGTVTSTASSGAFRDLTTSGFYDVAACRYPFGATCSNVLVTSSPAVPITCTSPEVMDPGQAQTSITGLTPASALGVCCARVSMLSQLYVTTPSTFVQSVGVHL
jgi:hypothetical protein